MQIAMLVALLALMLAPFAGRAFHMDDPLFLWAAKQIQINPANPYDFTVNWYGVEQPMSAVMENPPLASYLLALVGRIAGLTEVPAHLAFFISALAGAFGMYLVARRFCGDAVTAVAISVFTPVFFVSSLTVMSDVLMLTFWIFAVHFWLAGLERNSHVAFAAGALLIVLAVMTKFFGIALIPLLVAYSWLKVRGPGRWIVWMALPVVVLAGVEIAFSQLYGRGFLLGAAKYATGTVVGFGRMTPSKIAASLAFLGGSVASVAFLGSRLWSRSQLIGAAVFATATTALIVSLDEIASRSLPPAVGDRALFGAQLGIWMVAGIGLVALTIADVRRERSPESWFLALWVLGTFIFAGALNWTVNGRTILPVVVPVGILAVRRLEQRRPSRDGSRFAWISPPIIAAAALSVLVGWADTRLANVARDGATQLTTEFSGVRRMWFEGHWGFQYYMEQRGAKALYLKRAIVDAASTSPWALAPGDVIVVPETNTNQTPLPREWSSLRKTLALPSTGWVATMSIPVGAAFYTDEFGALPFAFGRVGPEQFLVFDVRQPAGR